mmetsp:Transcript_17019/g.55678  ORF Transcript_17019/g.55678 Transcript_17019/m.55678 type:complete len:286 (+) Transcript_17019:2050-2907(+)
MTRLHLLFIIPRTCGQVSRLLLCRALALLLLAAFGGGEGTDFGGGVAARDVRRLLAGRERDARVLRRRGLAEVGHRPALFARRLERRLGRDFERVEALELVHDGEGALHRHLHLFVAVREREGEDGEGEEAVVELPLVPPLHRHLVPPPRLDQVGRALHLALLLVDAVLPPAPHRLDPRHRFLHQSVPLILVPFARDVPAEEPLDVGGGLLLRAVVAPLARNHAACERLHLDDRLRLEAVADEPRRRAVRRAPRVKVVVIHLPGDAVHVLHPRRRHILVRNAREI